LVVRGDAIIAQSIPKSHRFNMPLQLGLMSGDTPTDADEVTVELQDGDIVIAGSDGLFDNLFNDAVMEEVACLTSEARLLSLDPTNFVSVVVQSSQRLAVPQRHGYDQMAMIAQALIGRNPTCTTHVAHRQVSGTHCALYLLDGEDTPVLDIVDLSTNGTFVNQERVVEPRPLHHGDIVTLSRSSQQLADEAGLPAYRVYIPWETRVSAPDELAERLAMRAFLVAQDRNADTPFTCAARAAGYQRQGGKLDDISVVVGIVTGDAAFRNGRYFRTMQEVVYDDPTAGSINPENYL